MSHVIQQGDYIYVVGFFACQDNSFIAPTPIDLTFSVTTDYGYIFNQFHATLETAGLYENNPERFETDLIALRALGDSKQLYLSIFASYTAQQTTKIHTLILDFWELPPLHEIQVFNVEFREAPFLTWGRIAVQCIEVPIFATIGDNGFVYHSRHIPRKIYWNNLFRDQ